MTSLDGSWALEVILVVLLIFGFGAAALLAVAEVSILRVRRSHIQADALEGDHRSQVLLTLLDDLPAVLNSVLFAVLLCQVAVASISGFLAQRWAGGIWIVLSSAAISLLLFVYAEAVPKTLAMRSPQERALRSAPWLRRLVWACAPIVTALTTLAELQSPAIQNPDSVSEQELRLLARQSAQAGSIGIADADLVDRSFAFGDRSVADVMVDREQIVAVSSDSYVTDALAIAIAAGHRRVIVVGTDLDDVEGVVRLRDLAAAATDRTVAEVMSRPLFCGPDDSIALLMERMRSSGNWLAIVTDAHGLTMGVATVEDFVAELLGEIEEAPVVKPADDAQVCRLGPVDPQETSTDL